MSIFSSYKKIFLFGFILVILAAIPLTLYVVQQRQQTTTKAAKATTIYFESDSTTVASGDTATLDINLDPNTNDGSNQVSFVKLTISYDPTKFSTVSGSFQASAESPNTLTTIVDGPTYGDGKASISLSIGADPTRALAVAAKIATFELKAISETNTTDSISFDPSPDTQVLSIASSDETSENVLFTATPITLTITTASTTATPTPTGTITTTPTSAPTPTSTSAVGSSPVCSSLEVDRSTTGTAPYSITFTINGTDSDGTISKAIISFGDGSTRETISAGGGIGTNTLSTQISHTYNNVGTYTAYAILTDNNNNLSNQSACVKSITVGSGQGGSGSTSTTVLPTDTEPLPTQATLPPTGPGETMLGIGAIGIIVAIIGGTLLILL